MQFHCCDCSLVHDIALAVEKDGRIGFAVRRNNRVTAARRRARQWSGVSRAVYARWRKIHATRPKWFVNALIKKKR